MTTDMTLYGSDASPYVRKVRIVMNELGLSDRVNYVIAPGTPYDPPGERARNPLRKIPVLEMSDGFVVYDSRVVIEAFLAESPEQQLLPDRGRGRIETLTRQALGDGICDSAVSISYERLLRPEESRYGAWIETQWAKVAGALDWSEKHAPPAGRFDLGDCALTAALMYLDYRFEDRPWREGRPRLAAFFESAKGRASVQATL